MQTATASGLTITLNVVLTPYYRTKKQGKEIYICIKVIFFINLVTYYNRIISCLDLRDCKILIQ